MPDKTEKPKPFTLPKSLLLGTATASAQIEGGDTNNSWYRWSAQKGNTLDNNSCLIADDHWNRVDQDITLMKKLNAEIYRFSIEWSRIEPEEGRFDPEAMAHYRDEIIKLKKKGIEPLVTLHHFSNPLWLEDSGSWLKKKVIKRFVNYTEYVVENLGDIVSEWVTINEPNVYLLFSFVGGMWPPQKKSIIAYIRGARNMVRAHCAAYKKIHEVRKRNGFSNTLVAAAHHIRVFDPKKGTLPERFAIFLQDRFFHQIFIRGMAEGKFILPLGFGHPYGRGRFNDFFGINYYSRDIISFSIKKPDQLFGEIEVKEGVPVNDLGWEIYPEGLYRICERYFNRYKLPIYITENGTADATDTFRPRYIYDHLYQIKRLIDAGIDVQRYYHWSLMDNFEWAEGYTARFGLIKVDYSTQKRKIRKSGKFFSEVNARKRVTREMIRKYL